MGHQTRAIYIGGCNAENVTKRMPDVRIADSIYRVPTACLSPDPLDLTALAFCQENERVWKRVRYEGGRRFNAAFTGAALGLIVIDFWRDCYVDLIDLGDGYLSMGLEMSSDDEIAHRIEASFPIIRAGTPEYEDAFLEGLSYQANLLAAHQPDATVVLLNSPPVRHSRRDGAVVALESWFTPDLWEARYRERYQWALSVAEVSFRNVRVVSAGDGLHSAPDAPWGEAALHYAPHLYKRYAERVARAVPHVPWGATRPAACDATF